MKQSLKKILFVGVIVVLASGGYYAWVTYNDSGLPAGIASGNGRIEATEIDISTKTAGRLREIAVLEGDMIKTGQVLARMDINQLAAQKRQAAAELRRAEIGVDTANSVVARRGGCL
ncbi:hypothetical protein GCM10007920_36740 [Ciceribacter naphthalenivorans]|uniref:Biotin/lipoyl-binding protein n=1 Tax=Sphingomonas psychrolutea TaxID=1259676 RepID=A0ABQ6EG54_9SPHN|nr:hypothetical protein GCM10007920_36740 [Ciceribacter naphthalenivorans]GLT06738.1 hypothetical protein GCM10007926_36740 [Sphingomonas psychrolutea]